MWRITHGCLLMVHRSFTYTKTERNIIGALQKPLKTIFLKSTEIFCIWMKKSLQLKNNQTDRPIESFSETVRPAINFLWNKRKWSKAYSGVFHISHPFSLIFAFHIKSGIRAKSRRIMWVYFFAALIKHEICMKYEKYVGSVSYFVVYFVN